MTKRRGPYLLDVKLVPERLPPNVKSFPWSLPVVRHLGVMRFHPKVTFLVGENGTGKSTLLEAIAVACGLNPEGGSRNFGFSTRASHSPLGESIRVARTGPSPRDSYFLRAESFYNLATEIERLDTDKPDDPYKPVPVARAYGDRSLHEQSHGESFFALFRNRLKGDGLYLFDEPEAALSPNRQIDFLLLLNRYVKLGGQFIIATHSPIIMAYPDAWIYVLKQDGMSIVPYLETDHYQVALRFLQHPQQIIRELFSSS